MFDKETVDTLVKAAVISALGETTTQRVMNDIVARLLETKVNSSGSERYDSFGGMPNTPLLNYLVDKEIRVVIENAVREHIANSAVQIKESVSKSLIENDGLANKISTMIHNQLADGYIRINVDLEPR